jgi:hypothetical protein
VHDCQALLLQRRRGNLVETLRPWPQPRAGQTSASLGPIACACCCRPRAPSTRTAPSSRRVPHQARRHCANAALAYSGSLACLQEFFKPKQVVYVAEKKWGDAERDKLYEARCCAPPRKSPCQRESGAPAPAPAGDIAAAPLSAPIVLPCRASRSSAWARGARFVPSCSLTCAPAILLSRSDVP